MEVLGPNVFSSERRMPSKLKAFVRVSSLWWGNDEKIIKEMENVREFVAVSQNLAQGLRQRVKDLGAALAAKSEAHSKIICPFQQTPNKCQKSR